MEVDTKSLKKSSMKLRTSGISLTEMTSMKPETRKSNNSILICSPEKQSFMKRSLINVHDEPKMNSGRESTMARE